MIRLAWAGARLRWRAHLGTALGVALTAALVVGALTIGDSLRATLLRERDARVGPVTLALEAPGRGVTAALAGRLEAVLGTPVAPLVDRVAVVSGPRGALREVHLLGVDPSLQRLAPEVPLPAPGEILLPPDLADRLGVHEGEDLVLRFERPSALPRETALTVEEGHRTAVRARVGGLLEPGWPAGFALHAEARPPRNALVDGAWLAEKAGTPGRVDRLLLAGAVTPERARDALSASWSPEDLDLEIGVVNGDVDLRSPRILLDPAVVDALDEAVGGTRLLTWFVDEARSDAHSVPYLFVTAAGGGPSTLADALPALADDAIALLEPLAEELDAQVGDTVHLRWPRLGWGRTVTPDEAAFRVAAVLPLAPPFDDPTLMPAIEGLADVHSCWDWSSGLPVDFTRIRAEDEAWWEAHRGTPRAFVATGAGERMWASAWGDRTGLRVGGTDPDGLVAALRSHLTPAAAGLAFRPVGAAMDAGAVPANDFGGLFVGFVFLLVGSALGLSAMLFALSLEGRRAELGALRAIGWPRARVRTLVLLEGGAVALGGTAIGLPAAVPIANSIINNLNSSWSSAIPNTQIEIAWRVGTLALGAVLTLLITTASLALATRRVLAESPRDLLVGAPPEPPPPPRRGLRWLALVLLAAAAIAGSGLGTERDPTTVARFFLAGGLIGLSAVGVVDDLLLRMSPGGRPRGLLSLGLAGAGRHRRRSLAVVALLAVGTFLVVGVAATGPRPPADPWLRAGGTGGFGLWLETSIPLRHPLDSEAGRAAWSLEGLADDSVVQVRILDGDDASCLNLGSAQTPRLLGVDPTALQSRRAFTFRSPEEGDWTLLAEDLGEGVIPAIGDEPTVRWGLHLGLGDELVMRGDRGEDLRVRIVGVLENTLLQGSLIVAEDRFVQAFPDHTGVRAALVDVPAAERPELASRLSRALIDDGAEVELTEARLAAFGKVENTYRSIFGSLGGLGVILGGAGVGVLLLRTLVERRGELALMRAVGFGPVRLGALLAIEHGALLSAGLGAGTLAAVVGLLPTLSEGAGAFTALGWLVASTGSVGLAATLAAARWTASEPPATVLREER